MNWFYWYYLISGLLTMFLVLWTSKNMREEPIVSSFFLGFLMLPLILLIAFLSLFDND